MNIVELKNNWEAFAKTNPLWAVLTNGKHSDYIWDEKAFFDNGKESVDWLMGQLRYTWNYPKLGHALDFGCGVGRLTINLASHFETVWGIDISDTMLKLAENFASTKGVTNCRFIQNTSDNLSVLADESFDFILSLITLQHMRNEYSEKYLKEFMRIVKPGGIIVFQIPEGITNTARHDTYVPENGPEMEMYSLDKSHIFSFVQDHDAEVRACIRDKACGSEVRSYRYIIRKNNSEPKTTNPTSVS